MRPTLAKAMRVIPRKNVRVPAKKIRTMDRQDKDLSRGSLIDVLLQRKEEAGASYPQNIRIERPLYARHYEGVRPEFKHRLKDLVKES